MYDIFYINYNEPFAEENYKILQSRFPIIKRVKNIKGIHAAHKAAAKLSFTKMFWVVDADAIVNEDFNFDFKVPVWDQDAVYVWYSCNPINDLKYGYGGLKLFPKNLMLDLDINTVDMTTSISKKFNVVPVVSNISKFNTDPFNTWKSAFRECAKLSSKVINRQDNEETEHRLSTWCTVGLDREFGKYAIHGANQGKEFAKNYSNDIFKINDFEWLRKEFEKVKI